MKTKLQEPIHESPGLIDIFRQSPISIELYDKDGFLLDANQACIDLFGLKNISDMKGLNLFTNPYLSEQKIADIKAGKSIKYELIYDFEAIKSQNLFQTTCNGSCYLECFINPTFNQSEEISGYIVHITEISERKHVQELLAKQAKELQEVNETRHKFMSIIAHDLKGPFSAILGFTELMLSNFDQLDKETVITGLETIESASKHAYQLLENLLTWARNQIGGGHFNPEMLNLKAQVNESLSMNKSAAFNKNIKITVSVSKDLYVFADKNMLDSILRNLISNAIKFSFKGGKIKISATRLETEIQISVSDNGIGISSERLSSIFRIDKHTNTTGTEDELGTGLGLILCKDFISQHNGKIWIESTLQEGTLVSISLPLNQNSYSRTNSI